MIVVHSSVWISYLNGSAGSEVERLDDYLVSELILVGDLVLAEVLRGFRRDRDYEVARRALTRFGVESMIGTDNAVRSAENYRLLRRRGVTVRKTIDCLIATFCIERGHRLLFSDRDFQPFVDHLGLAPA